MLYMNQTHTLAYKRNLKTNMLELIKDRIVNELKRLA